VRSFYYQDDQLQREHEALLLVKTLESSAGAVMDFVRSHHEYQLPEILQIAIEGGSSAYLNWLERQVAKPTR
jgi:periplasmic divalent cation tolerance protein